MLLCRWFLLVRVSGRLPGQKAFTCRKSGQRWGTLTVLWEPGGLRVEAVVRGKSLKTLSAVCGILVHCRGIGDCVDTRPPAR